ncbi:MAG: P63C domain-containing protein [Burkholderiales bacterium]|nr:P63C domain-containing protein [Burkholderiales bacterium]
MGNNNDERKSKGGIARAALLSPERRSEIAKQAASARWDADLPIATHEGDFKLGDTVVSSAVLPNGMRVITQATFLRALGRSRSPKAGMGVLSTVDQLPFFLQAEVLKPFISEELAMSTTPIFYRTKSRGKGVGYDARLLPQVAEVYLQYRDACLLSSGKEVPERYKHIVRAADVLMRALANVGIIALVDEATGFQRDRAKDALAKILEEFIAKELRSWVRTFPNDFYDQLFRLRGLTFPRDSVSRPKYFGHLTNDIIYKRLAPGVLEELKKATPKDEKGRYKHRLFQRLTEDVGHPKLREHLASVISLMKISPDYEQFERYLSHVHPRYGDTPDLPFLEEDNGQL